MVFRGIFRKALFYTLLHLRVCKIAQNASNSVENIKEKLSVFASEKSKFSCLFLSSEAAVGDRIRSFCAAH